MRLLCHVKQAAEMGDSPEAQEMQKGHALERNLLSGLGGGALSGVLLASSLPSGMKNVTPAMLQRARLMLGIGGGAVGAAANIPHELISKHVDPAYGSNVPGAERTDYNPTVPALLHAGLPGAGVAASAPLVRRLLSHTNITNPIARAGLTVAGILPGALGGRSLANYLEHKYENSL